MLPKRLFLNINWTDYEEEICKKWGSLIEVFIKDISYFYFKFTIGGSSKGNKI